MRTPNYFQGIVIEYKDSDGTVPAFKIYKANWEDKKNTWKVKYMFKK